MAMFGSLSEYLRGPDGAYTRLWGGLVMALIIGLLLLVNLVISNFPEGDRVKQDLEREFQLIQPLPQAASTGHFTRADRKVVRVANYYETSLSHEHILSYYDLELPKHDWKKCGESRKQIYWFSTRGETSSVYCKKSYKTYIVYHEEETGPSRSFGVRLEWDE